jgi:hypothetical protein
MIKMKLFCLALVLCFSINTNAQSTQDTLKQFIAELQKSPDNNALREKIILIAQRIKPAPMLPEEARKNFVMGSALLGEAKTKDDYELVIMKIKGAISIAPWYTEAYKQLGITQELSEHYDDAIKNIGFYMLSQLSDGDKQKAQDEIYIIEAKKEKANSPETIKKKEQDDFSAYLLKNEGAIFNNDVVRGNWGEIVIDNGSILMGGRYTEEKWLKLNPDDRGKLCRPHRYTFKQFIENLFDVDASGKSTFRTFTFSKDGKTITVNGESYDGTRYDMIFKRVN